MGVHPSRPVAGQSAIRSERFQKLFGEYEGNLLGGGYKKQGVRLQLLSIAHLGVWCQLENRPLETMGNQTVEAFERHRSSCRCPGTSRNRGRHVLAGVRGFLRHLRSRGVTPLEARPQPARWVQGFLRWMRVDRGVGESTLTSYGSYVGDLVRVLGDDPQAYTARGLRDFVAQRCRHYRRNSSRMVIAAVRMFLRYLTVEGQCPAGLEHALTPPANWSKQSLPRGLSRGEVHRVLARCPSTPRGLRDRAVLLLLIRLGLRASDVRKLRLSDLCFRTAVIRVSGKGGREVQLPMQQDVGDALLEYLRASRPKVDSEFVFLRSMAPFEPFARRPASKAVGHIARAALKRAGVDPPMRGAHVFRHTAACEMLRQGVSLEGIAEVLRHRSVETTGLYAKVDIALLETVAQPWPEVVPC